VNWLRRRLWEPLLALLKQGLSPEGLAWSVAVGLGIGVSPLFGSSTGLCIVVAAIFRLNQPAMQVANYLAYPLQLALLIPFIRLGERLFGAPRLPLSLEAIVEATRANLLGAIGLFWTSIWHAFVVWLIAAPLLSAALAFLLTPIFRAAAGRFRQAPV
jgi:uncharacterized protein (DUF2062 family)